MSNSVKVAAQHYSGFATSVLEGTMSAPPRVFIASGSSGGAENGMMSTGSNSLPAINDNKQMSSIIDTN